MNIERDKQLCEDYVGGEPMTKISDRTGISCTQLSRIFKKYGAKRKIYELDKTYFEVNADLTDREISEKTNIPTKRIQHLRRVAFNKPLSKGKLDFSDVAPIVDPLLINNRDWVYEQYAVQKLGTPSIARKLGTKASVVVKKLEEFEIELRSIKDSAKLMMKRPTVEWLQRHYEELKWSITKCANEFGTGFTAVYSALREYGFLIRDASEQHMGELNSFYGQEHDDETVKYCAEIGAYHGKQYWLTGDVAEKIEQVTQRAKTIWADPQKRAAQSDRITRLCMSGGCNSKQMLYVRERDQQSFLFRSSWEYAIALFLESCSLIETWDYETLSIPYLSDNGLKNYIIDFEVKWKTGLTTYIECKNKHLLEKENEQLKITAAKQFLKLQQSNLIVISNINDLKECNHVPGDEFAWWSNTRYICNKKYLERSQLYQELLRHYIMMRICPWGGIDYREDELQDDFKRIESEKIELYTVDGQLRSTVPSGRGMPGRPTILQFQPHFLNVVINNSKPLIEAFDNKWVIYDSIKRSMDENESLSLERLLREINFHYTKFSRTSHFATGFGRAIVRRFGWSGKRWFDPCCGWGGRLLAAKFEGCEYSGCDISPWTCNGLLNLNKHIGFNATILNQSCLECDWDGDFIVTSPPFYDIEEYIGGEQPWKKHNTREEWQELFVEPFVNRITVPTALYLDEATKNDFELFRKFNSVVEVQNKRHPRLKSGVEYLCVYS